MKPMTEAMVYAMRIAKLDGGVCAGKSIDRRGSVCTVFGSTLLALKARGLVATFISPDGGMGARLTPAGDARLVLLDSGNGLLRSLGMS